MKTISIGVARVHVINVGDFNFRLKDVNDVPEEEWRKKYYDVYENKHRYPSQCYLITAGDLAMMVDAGDYNRFATADSDYVLPNYTPPPTLVEQLANAGMSSQNVNYVALTHAHYDHYAGVTMEIGDQGENVPTFPNAIHFLGKEDYESNAVQDGLRNPKSEVSQTIGTLVKKGLLAFVAGGRDLSDEIEIISAPGETPGHKIVKISSKGETLYCVGDLFHHESEVENPSWMAKWDDHKTNLVSRKKLVESALKENALIAPAHMPLGRIEKNGSSVRFVAVT
jgi:glyoxylase-like metal-dependent hydrolase (beta-lactamase superfamily II)